MHPHADAPHDLDLDAVVRALRWQHLDAHLENTGGNTVAVVVPLEQPHDQIVVVTTEGVARYDRTDWNTGQDPQASTWIEPGTQCADTYIDLALNLCQP